MGKIFRAAVLGLASLAGVTLASVSSYAETLRIGGTGMGLAAMNHVGHHLATLYPNFKFKVLPSLGSSGGIQALTAGAIDIAITGRALKAKEQELNVREAACFTTALIFVTSHNTTENLALAALHGIYADPSPKWQDGTPLKIILRSRAGSENSYLFRLVPGIEEALDKAYNRPETPVAVTDQINAELATHTAGSFALMTLLQLRAEQLDLNVLPLDWVVASSTTLADKTYPMPIRICLVFSPNPNAGAVRFVEHIKSEAGITLLKSFEAILSN